MIAVQAEGCAPIVRAFEAGERFARPFENARTRAAGLRVPSAVGDFLILAALRESGGTAVAVDEDSITRTQLLAGRLGAGYVSPSPPPLSPPFPNCATAASNPDEGVVVFDCGIGQKYPPPPNPPNHRP